RIGADLGPDGRHRLWLALWGAKRGPPDRGRLRIQSLEPPRRCPSSVCIARQCRAERQQQLDGAPRIQGRVSAHAEILDSQFARLRPPSTRCHGDDAGRRRTQHLGPEQRACERGHRVLSIAEVAATVTAKAFGTCAGVLAAVGFYVLPLGSHQEQPADRVPSTPSIAARIRDDALRRARTHVGDVNPNALIAEPHDPKALLTRDEVSCRFVPHAPGGTSLKFDCTLDDGEVIRVKYGHQPEIHAEVAATRLLAALGYGADQVYMVRRVRCRGCPMNPFVTMLLLDALSVDLKGPRRTDDDDYRDFEWVSVERKFDAAPIEDEAREGWAWWELKSVEAPRVDLDAFRLIAVFLAHWDNKADNQRLVCMDRSFGEGRACGDSVLMIQDVGATFGPTKVDLARWRHMPVW